MEADSPIITTVAHRIKMSQQANPAAAATVRRIVAGVRMNDAGHVVEGPHKMPPLDWKPEPKPAPPLAPPGHEFMGEPPEGHSIVAEDYDEGIRVAMNPHGEELNTVFAEGAPERAVKRIGPAIARAMGELALAHENYHHFFPLSDDADHIPLGLIAKYVRRAHHGTSDGEILAAVRGLSDAGNIEPRPLADPDRLTTTPAGLGIYPLGGGKSMHTATMWNHGVAEHHWVLPAGSSGEGLARRLEAGAG
jgi:hypothetical protein